MQARLKPHRLIDNDAGGDLPPRVATPWRDFWLPAQWPTSDPGVGICSSRVESRLSLLQNSSGSGIYCREELLSLGARASRPHKTWQGRGDWLHRVGRFTRRLTLEQRLDKYAGGTPALPGGNPWLARCRSLSRALFCRSILPPSHARLRILQKARLLVMSNVAQISVRRTTGLRYWDRIGTDALGG